MSRRARLEWAKVTWDMGPEAWTSKWAWLRAILFDLIYAITGEYPKYMTIKDYVFGTGRI